MGLLAAYPFFGQLDHDILGHIQAAQHGQVFLYVLLPEGQPLQGTSGQTDEMVGEDESLGKDYPLAAAVGQIPLIPEGYVLEGGYELGPDDAGQAADLLRFDGISLVGHGGGANLLFAEALFHLGYLRPLESAHLHEYLVQGGCHQGHPADELGMPVALHHLVGYIHLDEAQMLHDQSLDLHALFSVGSLGAHCSAHLAHGSTGAQLSQPLDVPAHLRSPDGKAQAVGGGDSNLTVCPAGADQVLVLEGFVQQEG